MGLILATQRAAALNKNALGASWTFLMKQTQAAEFKLYREFGIEPEQALALGQGEAFVLAPGKPVERHQFRRRYSPDGAKTPGLAELQHHQQQARVSVQQQQQATSKLPEQQAQLPWHTSQPLSQSAVPVWDGSSTHTHLSAQRSSPSPAPSPASAFERDDVLHLLPQREAVNAVNGLHRPVNAGEGFTEERGSFTEAVNSERAGFTSEEEVQVLLAYADLLKAGEKVTRTAIRDRLGWNNK